MKLVPIEENGQVPLAAEDPSAAVPMVLEQTAALYRRCGFQPPWVGYLAMEGATWVGTCAFTGPPMNAEVEIAYFTFPGQEGRGVATRMASALIEATTAAAHDQQLAFIAHTLPQEGASTRILRRLGFRLLGIVEHPEDGSVWKWRKDEA